MTFNATSHGVHLVVVVLLEVAVNVRARGIQRLVVYHARASDIWRGKVGSELLSALGLEVWPVRVKSVVEALELRTVLRKDVQRRD